MIDLNCDMGEGFGRWEAGTDAAVMPLVTSANIACGAHAGDPVVMEATVALALQHGVATGAHPGYPDLQGFGRRPMSLTPHEIYTQVLCQIGALHAFTRSVGARLVHVKPHGALYNHAADDRSAADAIARAVAAFDPALILVGLAGSALVEAGIDAGLAVAREAFADRVYEPNGRLQDRRIAGAVRADPDAVVAQALMIARDRRVLASDGSTVELDADTICLHGDTRAAADLALLIRTALHEAGIAIRPLRDVLAARAS
jgi:5-oxoprolinase (ATP-hydrolysing) subunit A